MTSTRQNRHNLARPAGFRHSNRPAGALALTLLAIVVLPPAPAAGQSCISPPGMSGIDQYCEAIPGPGGDRGAGDSVGPGERVPAGSGRALPHRGTRGAARRGSANALPGRADAPSDDPLKAVTSAATSGATVGPLFLGTLLAMALALVALTWLRARRRAPTA